MNIKYIKLCLTAITAACITSASAVDINMSKAKVNDFYISQTSDKNIQYVNCQVGKIVATNVSTQKGSFVSLSADKMINMGNIGNPELPAFTQLIEIPQEAKVKLTVVSYSTETIALSSKSIQYKVKPMQEPTPMTGQAPAFSYASSSYAKNAYMNTTIAKFEEAGTMRDVRFGRIIINPIQYNPSTNTIKVMNNLKVKVEFVGADYTKTATLKKNAGSSVTQGLTETFMSSNLGETTLRSSSTYQKETMVIVAHSKFQSELKRYVTHKKFMGLNVIEHYISNYSNSAIKNLIKSDYNNPPSGQKKPLYLLLVGDTQEIPSFGPYTEVSNNRTYTYYSDLPYTLLQGSDSIPDILCGRFSANTVAQLRPQIDKTIEYETYSMPDPSYNYKAVLISGYDSDNYQEANSQMNYAANVYCNSSNNMTSRRLLQNANEQCHTSSIIQEVNNGVGLLNYCGHGSEYAMIGQFSTGNISSLNNSHKYGIWISNTCSTNSFYVGACLGEELLRAENKGAVAFIGASCLTYWRATHHWAVGYRSNTFVDPTYDAAHKGMYDKLFHTNTTDINDRFSTTGGLMFAGNMAVYAADNYTYWKYGAYYTKVYHLMGDPSIYVRFTPPTECDDDMTIVKNINDGNRHEEFVANRSITATNTISNRSSVHYGANYKVTLKKGFKVTNGAKLQADTRGCNQKTSNGLLRSARYEEVDEPEMSKEEESALSEYKLYPNPTDGIFTLDFNEEDGVKTVIVFNAKGEGIYAGTFSDYMVDVNISGNIPGLYFVRIVSDSRVETKSLILK